MNLLHLQYFHRVATEGGFTKASQALGIRQPAISRMVAQLENNLGFKLLERGKQQVTLTAKGRQVFDHANSIFNQVDQLVKSLGEIKGECFGDLKFAAAEPIATTLVPLALKDYRRLHPRVYPQFMSGAANHLLKSIQRSELEFGLFFHTPDLPAGLAIVKKIPVPFHLVIHSKFKSDPQARRQFVGSREIDDTATRRFPTLEKWRKFEPKCEIAISTNNLTAHKQMVLDGLGIAVLPAFLISKELSKGTLIDLLPKENLRFDLKVVFRETSVPSLNGKKFLENLQEQI